MSQHWRVVSRGRSQGQVFTLSCRDHKESEPRPEEVPRDRARGPRAKSEIHTCWGQGREPGRTQSRKEASLEQIKEAPGRLSPVVRNCQLVQLCRSWGVAACIRL